MFMLYESGFSVSSQQYMKAEGLMIKFETLKAAGTKTALDKVYEADETSADSTDHADDRSLREPSSRCRIGILAILSDQC